MPPSAFLLAQLLTLDPLLRGKLEVTSEAGCWIWTGATQQTGHNNEHGLYGRIRRKGKLWLAHRWVFWLIYGSIPPGHHVHHRIPEQACTSTLCCNPRHIEAVDASEHNWIHREMDAYDA